MAMSRSFGATSLTTRPPIEMVPPESPSSPAIIRSSVDLPQPEGPTSTQNSSCSTTTSTPCRTSVEPKLLRTPERVTDAMLALHLLRTSLRRSGGEILEGRGQVSRAYCGGQVDLLGRLRLYHVRRRRRLEKNEKDPDYRSG